MLLRITTILAIKTLIAALFFTTTLAGASDLAREKRLAEQIVDAIFVGEPIYLEVSDHKFLAIHTEPEKAPSKGGVILLHGRGYHADWEHVIHPLRTGLAERGWRTLSLQMPVLEKDAKYYDYVPILQEAFPRLDAGVTYLRKQGERDITVIAHSCSVHMTMAWLEQHKKPPVNAYIGIGMGATDYRQPMAKPYPLETFRFPVLDLYGVNEYNAVIKGAPGRYNRIGLAGNLLSRQVVLPEADHYFEGLSEPLLDTISAWLNLLR